MSQYIHLVPGRLRLRIVALQGREEAARVACRSLCRLAGVLAATVNPVTGSLTVRYDPRRLPVERLMETLGSAGYLAPDIRMDPAEGLARQFAECTVARSADPLAQHSASVLIGALA